MEFSFPCIISLAPTGCRHTHLPSFFDYSRQCSSDILQNPRSRRSSNSILTDVDIVFRLIQHPMDGLLINLLSSGSQEASPQLLLSSQLDGTRSHAPKPQFPSVSLNSSISTSRYPSVYRAFKFVATFN